VFCGPSKLGRDRIAFQISGPESLACPCNFVYLALSRQDAVSLALEILRYNNEFPNREVIS
jgi:hypothetical protein